MENAKKETTPTELDEKNEDQSKPAPTKTSTELSDTVTFSKTVTTQYLQFL